MPTSFGGCAVLGAIFSGILVLASNMLPSEYLQVLDAVPVKRLLLVVIGINLVVAGVAIYHIVFLPTPARVVHTILVAVVLPLIPGILIASGRPEEIRVEGSENSGLWPKIAIKFAGLDIASAILVGMMLAFIYLLAKSYASLYPIWVSPPPDRSRSSELPRLTEPLPNGIAARQTAPEKHTAT